MRQNLLIYLLTGRRPEAYQWESDGAAFDAMHLVEHLAVAGGEEIPVHDAVTYLLRFALGREPGAERVATLTDFVEKNGGRINNQVLIGLLSLITAMPEYQLC